MSESQHNSLEPRADICLNSRIQELEFVTARRLRLKRTHERMPEGIRKANVAEDVDRLAHEAETLREEIQRLSQSAERTSHSIKDDPGFEPEVLSKNTLGVLVMTILDQEWDAIKTIFAEKCVESGELMELRLAQECVTGKFSTTKAIVRFVLGTSLNTGNSLSGIETARYISSFQRVSRCRLDYAILVGICAAATNRKANPGDVVVPTDIFKMSIYKMKLEEGELVRMNEVRAGKPDHQLLKMAKLIKNDSPWRERIMMAKPDGTGKNVELHLDPLFTDNVFLQDGGRYISEAQLAISRKGLAYDMEAGGFATACEASRVPYLVVRGISDWADDSAADRTWRPFAAKSAAAFALAIVEQGILPGK